MRLWSLHPQYLDAQGLVALWREGLLALKVLEGLTRGYRRHPQLERFRACPDPPAVLRYYLDAVYQEASRRGYQFSHAKIEPVVSVAGMEETEGQLLFEWSHLLAKLARRSPALYAGRSLIKIPQAHPLFSIIPGGARAWERDTAAR